MIQIVDNILCGVRFGDLPAGKTFKYGSNYYIAISHIASLNGDVNAVQLDNGARMCFKSNDIVIPFNCELIVL